MLLDASFVQNRSALAYPCEARGEFGVSIYDKIRSIREVNKYTKKELERKAGIIFRCIGWSIAFIYVGGFFFVPGLMLFWMLISLVTGESGLSFQYVCIPICIIYVFGCVGYACYSIGQENK